MKLLIKIIIFRELWKILICEIIFEVLCVYIEILFQMLYGTENDIKKAKISSNKRKL